MTRLKRYEHYWLASGICVMSVAALCAVGCGGGSRSSIGSGGGTTTQVVTKEWTWVGGSDQANSTLTLHGSYGTEGVASASNEPPGRFSPVTWIDRSGNFWMFGGEGNDPQFTNGPYNDLWEYSPSTKEWTWMSGSSTVPGNQMAVYGTEGTASAGNVPGGRTESVSWMDGSGNFWLFGGAGFDANGSNGTLNDLWEYSPSTKEWTWMGGSSIEDQAGSHGTLGVAASTNIPGARSSAVSWTDPSGNFWLFGGDLYVPNSSSNLFNDLWKYSPSTREWTWMGGSMNSNAVGVYGTEGTAATGNVPGARDYAVSWTDGSGNLWLFGGFGVVSMGGGADLNDLWEFNPSTNQWTWVSGSNTVNVVTGKVCVSGVYGTEGTAGTANVPGGRNGANGWMDASGNLWLFGGLGCDMNGTQGSLNDLWEYSPASKSWTWQSGSNSVVATQSETGGASGVYGTMGTAAATNTPGGHSSSATWTDSSGTFWLFGGVGHDATGMRGELNDLWSYTP